MAKADFEEESTFFANGFPYHLAFDNKKVEI